MKLLDERWLNSLPAQVTDNLQELNTGIINVICERIKKIGGMSASDAIRLTNSVAYMGADFKKIEELISNATSKNKKEIYRIFEEVAQADDDFASLFYKYRGLEPSTHQNTSYLMNLRRAIEESTIGRFANLSDTYAFKTADKRFKPLRQVYSQAIDKAIYEVNAGTLDYNTAMRQTVMNLADGGMRVVEWESGVHRRVDTAARMNILDGVRKLNQEMMLYHAEQYGSDGVELSAHAISAPDHMFVQGHQFSNEEFERMQRGEESHDVNGNSYPAFSRPIGIWNCRHFAIPIVIGVSEPVHSDYELNDMVKNSKQKYDLTQEQRKKELELRKLKDRRKAFTAAGNDLEAQRTQLEINKKQKEYTAFCNKNGITPQPIRARVPGYRPISTKELRSTENSAIILSSDEQRAINSYISSGSYVINGKLRNGEELTDSDKLFVRHLDSALDKLPKYEGDVVRELKLTRDEAIAFALNHKVGKPVRYRAYTSTSTKAGYHDFPNIVMKLKSTKGIDLRSFNPGESEILYKRDSEFKVIDITFDKNKTIVHLEEL